MAENPSTWRKTTWPTAAESWHLTCTPSEARTTVVTSVRRHYDVMCPLGRCHSIHIPYVLRVGYPSCRSGHTGRGFGAQAAQWVKRWPTDLAVPSWSLARGEIFSTVNGVTLHTAFQNYPPIVLIWLKYCWKDVKSRVIHPFMGSDFFVRWIKEIDWKNGAGGIRTRDSSVMYGKTFIKLI